MTQKQKSVNFLQEEADDSQFRFPLFNDQDVSYLGNLYIGSPDQ